jgi:hypothetical protein
VLIDPEGRVVDFGRKSGEFGSEACERFLASKLTPIPQSKRIERSLDHQLALYVDERPLAELIEFYGTQGQLSIQLDRSELNAVGLTQDVEVPLKVDGRHTLRSWLNLALDPFRLTYVVDGDGLRIVRRSTDNSRLSQRSARQEEENTLIAEALKKKITLEFHGESLKQFVSILEAKTDETFCLDAAARLAGTIRPEAKVNGSVVAEPLASALTRLLAPLGMSYVIRDECVILTKAH